MVNSTDLFISALIILRIEVVFCFWRNDVIFNKHSLIELTIFVCETSEFFKSLRIFYYDFTNYATFIIVTEACTPSKFITFKDKIPKKKR